MLHLARPRMVAHGIAAAGLASAALMALALTGCGSGNAINTGPFGNGSDPSSVCGPSAPGGVVTDGMVGLVNSGHSVAVVERVTLHDPRHLVIVGAWVVPINNTQYYGVFQGWPQGRAPRGVKWSQAVRAAGARVPPARGRHSADLVVVLKLIGAKGTARNIDVFYRESGQQYHLQYNSSIGLTRAPTCNLKVPAPTRAG